MSMELLTYPWMKDFFGDDTDKYLFSHFSNRLLAIPNLCAMDHFQHIIYEHPEYTPEQRNAVWKEMEQLYLPDNKMDMSPHLRSGRYWQSILHVFEVPFYMIDYALAQICAFQFWKRSLEDKEAAWNDFLRLCQAGCTKPFLDLVELAGLDSPFEDGTIQRVVSAFEDHLSAVDDSQF